MERIDAGGILFLAIIGVGLPYLILKSRKAAAAGASGSRPLPRKAVLLRNVVVMHVLLLALALLTARGREWDLFAPARWTPPVSVVLLAFVGGALALLPVIWRRTGEEQRRHLLLTRPTRPADLGPWAVVSASAGFCEEVVYRGVLFRLVRPLAGSWGIAVTLCALAFSLGHAGQGWRRAAYVGLMAVVFHLLVRMSGSLWPAMAAHGAYDFLAGCLYLRLAGGRA